MNDFIFNSIFSNPNFLLQRSKEEVENYHSAIEEPLKDPATQKQASYRRPPTAHFVKVNWDAAIDTKRKKIVARDSKGEALACLSSNLSIPNPLLQNVLLFYEQWSFA